MRKTKIMVVEDDHLIAKGIKYTLEEDDFEVIIGINNVEEAILKTIENSPDLILIDINLKGNKDGIDFANYLLHNHSVPFIYISSIFDKLTLERIKETRPYGFIVKPFKEADLKTSVAIVLSNYLHKNIDPIRSNLPIKNDLPFRIRNVINHINENIGEKIELDDLATVAKLKVHHFIRVFTKELRITPYQYILKRKIDVAKALLEETNQPICDIAFDLGFQAYSNFTAAFKRMNDMLPEEYRKLHKAMKHLSKTD